LTKALQAGEELSLDDWFINALRNTLNDESLDPAFRELMLTLPSEAMIAEAFDVVDPQAIHAARQFVRATITHHLKADLLHAYETHQTPGKYVPMLYRWRNVV
jgi:aminopeptidase N